MRVPSVVLDLYCGAGGAAMGLHQVWPDAEIIGIDIIDQPHYPFKFYRGDVKTFGFEYSKHDFVWASPVCKRYTCMSNCREGYADFHPNDIGFIRALLKHDGKPFVIENVMGAPLINPIMLCGRMFNLDLYRHRLFEANFPLVAPSHPKHNISASRAGHWKPGTVMSVAGNFAPVEEGRRAMGITWMTRNELAQAVPPAYSRYIALQYTKGISI
jgi:DNA (cytosine-5)-methyltransferase 1